MNKLKNGTVEKIGGTSLWRVVSPFYWLLDYREQDGYVIIAKEGFTTDYGSIPRFLRVFFDPTKYNSFVIHDVCYSTKRKYHKLRDGFSPLTRKEADMILLEGITYEGAGFLERLFIYLGVRIFGFLKW